MKAVDTQQILDIICAHRYQADELRQLRACDFCEFLHQLVADLDKISELCNIGEE